MILLKSKSEQEQNETDRAVSVCVYLVYEKGFQHLVPCSVFAMDTEILIVHPAPSVPCLVFASLRVPCDYFPFDIRHSPLCQGYLGPLQPSSVLRWLYLQISG